MNKKLLETLRESGLFQIKKLLRHGGSYQFIIPRALAELIGTDVEGDFWVSYELTEGGKLEISPLAVNEIEKFKEFISES